MYNIPAAKVNKRELKAEWSVDPVMDFEVMFGTDAVEELAKSLAEEIKNGT